MKKQFRICYSPHRKQPLYTIAEPFDTFEEGEAALEYMAMHGQLDDGDYFILSQYSKVPYGLKITNE